MFKGLLVKSNYLTLQELTLKPTMKYKYKAIVTYVRRQCQSPTLVLLIKPAAKISAFTYFS